MLGLESTERGHQLALASAVSPGEALEQSHGCLGGVNELLSRMSERWAATGCQYMG